MDEENTFAYFCLVYTVMKSSSFKCDDVMGDSLIYSWFANCPKFDGK